MPGLSARRLTRVAAGLTLAGLAVVACALVSGNRTLAPTWDALRTVGCVATMVWTWASTPRLDREPRE